ncbi:MAG: hypothetical protein ACYDDB_04070 [bacterium]
MKKAIKKIFIFFMIIIFTAFYTLSVMNTRNAFAFVVPSISGVVSAAGSMADAGESLVAAGKIIGLAIPLTGPFGLSTSVAQWLQGKSTAMLDAGKVMADTAKLQVALAKVQSSINAATNAVQDVYSADADITGARNDLLSNGITMNNCTGGQGIMGSVAAENCTEESINSNISAVQGTYSDLGDLAGVSGNGISSALAGSSANQAALTTGVNNFSAISENGLGGSVAISSTSNLCQDELAAGMVTSASQCTESYQRAMNSQLNKNLLVGSTEGVAQANATIMEGSGFSNAVSNVSGSYDLQQVELLKLLAQEQAQNLKATGALTQQIAIGNQIKAAKEINNKQTPVVSKPNDPIQEMQNNGWYH